MAQTTEKHKHHCQCDHERVQFCKTCRVVHCLDCKEEWRSAVQTLFWGQYQPYTYSYNGNTDAIPRTFTTAGESIPATSDTVTTQAVNCTHSAS